MSPKVEKAKPAYEQIYEDLREQILGGKLPAGAKVKSARELASEWQVQPNTAMKALKVLGREGLTEVIPGKGTFVRREQPDRTAQDRLRAIRRSGRIYPDSEYARILEAETTAAPDHIANALGIEPGEPVIRRLRVTVNRETETPVSASTSWFPGRFATTSPALLQAERLPEGTPAYIERTVGIRITAGREQMAADRASQAETDLLQIEAGEPVRRGRNWMFDTRGDVIEYGESVAIAGRWSTYSYEIQPETEG